MLQAAILQSKYKGYDKQTTEQYIVYYENQKLFKQNFNNQKDFKTQEITIPTTIYRKGQSHALSKINIYMITVTHTYYLHKKDERKFYIYFLSLFPEKEIISHHQKNRFSNLVTENILQYGCIYGQIVFSLQVFYCKKKIAFIFGYSYLLQLVQSANLKQCVCLVMQMGKKGIGRQTDR